LLEAGPISPICSQKVQLLSLSPL